MPRRRVALTLSVFCLLSASVIGVVSPVAAQTSADEELERAEREVDDAYSVVDAAVEGRAEIEAQLFEALDRYAAAAAEVGRLSVELADLDQRLVLTEARVEAARATLESQAVAAYIQAVSSTSTLILDTGTMETAMVASETLRRGSAETLTALDSYRAFTDELVGLRDDIAARRSETEAARAELERDADELEVLFAAANQEVAAAYQSARVAEATLQRAADAVRAAEIAEAARATATTAPATPSSTTTPAPTATGPEPPPTTTTTSPPTIAPPEEPPPSWPPIPINRATMAWRSLLETHFASDLVLDALVIIQCESLGDPNAVNPYSGASGLFQFMPGTWAVASVEAGVASRSVLDGEANIIAASWLAEYYRSRGTDPWRPWACRRFL